MIRPPTLPRAPMAEHPIHLRRAWDILAPGGSLPPRRVDLPAEWPTGAAPARLARRFRRPPIDPHAEALALRLEAVPGLRSVRLNGQPLAGAGPEFPLDGPLPQGNLLELEIDPDGVALGLPWGRIALVIRPRAGGSP